MSSFQHFFFCVYISRMRALYVCPFHIIIFDVITHGKFCKKIQIMRLRVVSCFSMVPLRCSEYPIFMLFLQGEKQSFLKGTIETMNSKHTSEGFRSKSVTYQKLWSLKDQNIIFLEWLRNPTGHLSLCLAEIRTVASKIHFTLVAAKLKLPINR